MDWKAKWIWDDGEEQPRNYWLCFRKSMRLDAAPDEAKLHITADSRYVLYINGSLVAMGPVKSWPGELSYDTYDICHRLKQGNNTIAVLVTHFGVSNYAYIEGRGGLIAQLELQTGQISETLATDNTWKAHVHSGYMRNSVRINMTQAWAEIYDARSADTSWSAVKYDDSQWKTCIEIGEYDMAPWFKLIPRDIPFMREEPVYPARMEALRNVAAQGKPVSIDLQPNFQLGLTCEPSVINGFLATEIHTGEKLSGKLCFPWNLWAAPFGWFRINETEYNVNGNEKEFEIILEKGINFFLMDLNSVSSQGFFVHMNFLVDRDISFYAPGHPGNTFVTAGPAVEEAGKALEDFLGLRDEIWNSKNTFELMKHANLLKPVQNEHVCNENVYMSTVFRNVVNEFDVTEEIQNLIVPNEEYSWLKPYEAGDMELTVDFGRETAGYLEFELDAPEGTIIDLYGVEYIHFNEIRNIYPDNKIEHSEDINCTLRYFCREGRQTYRSFIHRGFRYIVVTIRGASRPVKFYRIFVNQNTYPVLNSGRFECSDWKLNRIWEACRLTTQLCMDDTFVDCPMYEKLYWVGDARNEAMISYYTFGAYELSRRCLRLAAGSMERSFIPESHVPSGVRIIIPTWSLLWVYACKEYYFYSGDRDFLEEIYPSIEKAVKALYDCIDGRGLLILNETTLLDWAPLDCPGGSTVAHENAEYVKALEDTAYMAIQLGYADKACEYKIWADKLINAINIHFWDADRLAFADSIHADGRKSRVFSIQTNLMMYLCGCADGERKTKLEEYIVEQPRDFVKIASPFVSFFHYEALAAAGKIETAIADIDARWGAMLDIGANTCTETFPSDNYLGYLQGHYTRSYCHAWSAAPAYFMGAYILGVRPLEPGSRKVLIDPAPCGLKWARGSVPVPGGRIDIQWKQSDGGLELYYRGPAAIQYEFGENVIVK